MEIQCEPRGGYQPSLTYGRHSLVYSDVGHRAMGNNHTDVHDVSVEVSQRGKSEGFQEVQSRMSISDSIAGMSVFLDVRLGAEEVNHRRIALQACHEFDQLEIASMEKRIPAEDHIVFRHVLEGRRDNREKVKVMQGH